MKTLTLWHGGRDLEYNYHTFQSSRKGKWEHGPGIYLTTHYERASSYAKGGGKTYLVEFSEGKHIEDIKLSLADVYEFVNTYTIKKKSKEVIDCIKNNAQRTSSDDTIRASYFLNIMINFDAVSPSKTNYLNQFLVEHGVDYGTVNNFGGRPETVFIIFNNKIIQKVKSVASKDVHLNQWEIPVEFVAKISPTL